MFCISVLYFLLYFWFDILLSNTVTFIFIYSAITRSGALSEMKDKKNSKCKKQSQQSREITIFDQLHRCWSGVLVEVFWSWNRIFWLCRHILQTRYCSSSKTPPYSPVLPSAILFHSLITVPCICAFSHAQRRKS